MSNTEPLKITELRKRFDAEKPKYICLRNDQDETEVPWNPVNMTPEKRMKEIEAWFKRESTPDGLYYFIQKDSNVSSAKERRTPVAKGNIKTLVLREKPQERTQTLQVKATEVWDMNTALDKMSQIAELKFENRFLSEENIYLKKRVAELEAELDEVTPEPDEKTGGAKGAIESLKGLAEIFTPALEKHLELKEKEINQRERYMTSRPSGRAALSGRASRNGSDREDGGIPANDPGYEEYFCRVMDEGSDEEFDMECDYLEKTSPELYARFNEKYELDAEEEVDPEDEEHSK